MGDETTAQPPLIVCVDVDYRDAGAVAAGVWFRGWSADAAEFEADATFANVAEYQPGQFYLRELPCLLGVLACGPKADVVVVDGYVWLGGGRPGLGAHLHRAIGGVVVGVAKTRFAPATDAVPVLRGGSKIPLYVSAEGVPAAEAGRWVGLMHGPHRVPTLLRRVDTLARTGPGAYRRESSSGRFVGQARPPAGQASGIGRRKPALRNQRAGVCVRPRASTGRRCSAGEPGEGAGRMVDGGTVLPQAADFCRRGGDVVDRRRSYWNCSRPGP
ncbi:MAG: endonuclease V [Isosphaeraceae bacterium]